MLKFIMPMIFIGCMHKNIETETGFKPSGSMCLDSFNMNIKNSQCSEIDETILNNKTVSITCTKSYTDTFWTNRTFYIIAGDYSAEAVGIIPICLDQNIMIMTGDARP
jgi:hypothetical protein